MLLLLLNSLMGKKTSKQFIKLRMFDLCSYRSFEHHFHSIWQIKNNRNAHEDEPSVLFKFILLWFFVRVRVSHFEGWFQEIIKSVRSMLRESFSVCVLFYQHCLFSFNSSALLSLFLYLVWLACVLYCSPVYVLYGVVGSCVSGSFFAISSWNDMIFTQFYLFHFVCIVELQMKAN